MKDPFEILGIEPGITQDDIIKEFDERIKKLEELCKIYDEKVRIAARDGISYRGSIRRLSHATIEEALSERFACGITPNSKFLSPEELDKVYKKIKDSAKLNKEKSPSALYNANVFSAQLQRMGNTITEIRDVEKAFLARRHNPKAIEDLQDLYIRLRFEDAVSQIGPGIASISPRFFDEEKDEKAFTTALSVNPRYLDLREAYEKIATKHARADAVPELFITSRLGNPELLKIANPAWKELIVKREQDYYDEYLRELANNFGTSPREKFERGVAENQNHDYRWGVVLDKPTPMMQGIQVKNSDFTGRISVQHMGYMTSETMFRKSIALREKHEKITSYAVPVNVDGKERIFHLRRHVPNPKVPEYMRDYYYKHQATMYAYNNIYKVTKTDEHGVSREDIVFSPVEKDEFGTKYPMEFLSNVYFSNYMLDIAKENGGFNGVIVESPKGSLSISTVDNRTDIAVGVLYQSNSMGSLVDKTEEHPSWREITGSEVDILLRYGMDKEKERQE